MITMTTLRFPKTVNVRAEVDWMAKNTLRSAKEKRDSIQVSMQNLAWCRI